MISFARTTLVKIGLPKTLERCQKELKRQTDPSYYRARVTKYSQQEDRLFEAQNNLYTWCVYALFFVLVLVLTVFITVAVFVINGKCPGQEPRIHQQSIKDPYEKAILDYAALQTNKFEKRLNNTRAFDMQSAAERKSEQLVYSINDQSDSYIAKFNPSAVGMEEQKLLSEKISETTTFSNEIYEAITEMLNLVKINGPFHRKYVEHLTQLYAQIQEGIPRHFAANEKWPECDITRVYDQGGCGSCWAVASASIISDRICIKSGGQKVRLSAQKLIECCIFCGGCNGSVEPLMPFYYYTISGLVSEECYPYTVVQDCGHPCKLETYFNPKGVHNCSDKCADGQIGRRWHADYVYRLGTVNGNTSASIMNSLSNTFASLRHKFNWRHVDDLTLAKAELMLHGPLELCFRVFEGFLHYFEGTYKVIEHLETLHVYDHCVKVIGWGIDKNGREYFRCINSWGKWGKDGTFEIDIEMLKNSRGDMYAAIPNMNF